MTTYKDKVIERFNRIHYDTHATEHFNISRDEARDFISQILEEQTKINHMKERIVQITSHQNNKVFGLGELGNLYEWRGATFRQNQDENGKHVDYSSQGWKLLEDNLRKI